MSRTAVRLAQVLLGAALLVWIADHAAVQARGEAAFGTVTVHRFLTTPLKGRKEEYDYLGDEAVRCSRSVYPQAGNAPCWWVALHTTVWE